MIESLTGHVVARINSFSLPYLGPYEVDSFPAARRLGEIGNGKYASTLSR